MDIRILNLMENCDIADRKQILYTFIEQFIDASDFQQFRKSGIWDRLWRILFEYLRIPQSVDTLILTLRALRILSRDKASLALTHIDEQMVDILLKYAELKDSSILVDAKDISENDSVVIIEAMKCLSNMVYHSEKVQEILSKNSAMDNIIRRIRLYPEANFPFDVKYFDMKLLFLISALRPDVRRYLREELHATTYLMEILDVILKESGAFISDNHLTYLPSLDEYGVSLSCEILKVMFNLTVAPGALKDGTDGDWRLFTVIREILLATTPDHLRDNLINDTINLLTNASVASLEMLVPQEGAGWNTEALDAILASLHRKLKATQDSRGSAFEILSPVLTVLIQCARHHRIQRKHIRYCILPPLRHQDLMRKPEDGDTIRNMLCALLTSPDTHLKQLVAEFLFVICKENVSRMVKYTGFGNAAGLLASKGLLGAASVANQERNPNYSSDSDNSDTEEYTQFQNLINPVTGHYEFPKPKSYDSMSEEQKEEEVMKVVNMMDKLSRDGIIQPCRIGDDGKPQPVEHILQLQEELPNQFGKG